MKKSLSITLLLVAVFAPAVQSQVTGSLKAVHQNNYTLTLEPGRILLNGKEIPADELPASLDLSGINTSFNLTGDSVLDINGHVYQLRGEQFIEIDSAMSNANNVMVYVNGTGGNGQSFHIVNRQAPSAVFFGKTDTPHEVVMKNYFVKMNEQAVEFEKIRNRMGSEMQSEAQDRQFALELRIEAENAYRIASAFPSLEYEGYLMGIREKDTRLYQGLVREQQMEMNTHGLASKARASATPAEREKFVNELRTQLKDIFELKQNNREDEITQLSQRLQELTALMSKRADLQERIIEKRLKELLGELDW